MIGITLGDPAGIGPEIIAKALDSGRIDPEFQYRVIGEPIGAPGLPTAETAKAAWKALEDSARMLLSGEIEAVVTGPIAKANLQEIGFQWPGHTEFYAERCGISDYAMCLTGGPLTVALVTTHIPLAQVASALSQEEIVRVGKLLARFLAERFGGKARVAVAGLNPHAGESGKMGREEIELISPAVEKLNRAFEGRPISFSEPISPDTLFHRAAAGEFDGVLCMYHDQGLIPLKLLAFDQGVNVTLGLPVIRTSPDHGTAFAIAGKGIARPDSMIAAINLAAEMIKRRRSLTEEARNQ
jgi:4-hydroxythreonine-4-phosphate dehydrogenase